MTTELIKKSQSGDKEAAIELIEKYNPLLKSLAYKLHYDDAYNDLVLDLIVLLKSINLAKIRDPTEACLISYIAKSMRCAYSKRLISKQMKTAPIPFSELSEEQLYYIDVASSSFDQYREISAQEFASTLTVKEWDIIHLIYYEGYSSAEIARRQETSRQAVNQIKQRALKKLYHHFSDKH